MMMTKVRDLMTTPVVAVKRDASFKDLAALLRKHRVSAFPVVDDGCKLIGVVSEADLLVKEALSGDRGEMLTGLLHHRDLEKADGVTAGDLMTGNAVTVRPDDTVEQAARLMYHLRVGRLPVTDAGGYLVGIISRTDVLAVYGRPDDEIRAEITGGVIPREFRTDPAVFTVTVADGVVTLRGTPQTAELGRNLTRRIRHVQGVVAIRDELVDPPAERYIAAPYF